MSNLIYDIRCIIINIFSAVVRPVDRRDLPGLSPASDCIETWVVLLRRPQASMINAIPPIFTTR